MNEQRIYGKKVAIDTSKVKDFYDQQAKGRDRLSAVLLGNPSAELLEQRNAYCRDYIQPLLCDGPCGRVLDLGCGVGRWAEFLLPGCGCYCGVDFSPEMIRQAEETCRSLGGEYQLHCLSVVDAAAQSAEFFGGRFDLVLLAGVLPYLNDAEAERLVCCLPNLLLPHCTIFLGGPVGVGRRLTLNDFPSQALHTAYNVIYRTDAEYRELFAPLLAAGFSIVREEPMPRFGDQYTDTRRSIMILRR